MRGVCLRPLKKRCAVSERCARGQTERTCASPPHTRPKVGRGRFTRVRDAFRAAAREDGDDELVRGGAVVLVLVFLEFLDDALDDGKIKI